MSIKGVSLVYFGNVDAQVTEPLMYELFLQFAPVKLVHMPRDRVLQTHQGYGFVEFHSSEDAAYVIEILRGIRLYGRPLKLGKTEAARDIDVGAKVFVNNLHPMVDSQVLTDTFTKFGAMAKPPQVVREANGDSKGYGFVWFNDFAISDEAIAKMNGAVLMGNKVVVEYALKEGGKPGERHGDPAERLLVEQAKRNHVIATRGKKRKAK